MGYALTGLIVLVLTVIIARFIYVRGMQNKCKKCEMRDISRLITKWQRRIRRGVVKTLLPHTKGGEMSNSRKRMRLPVSITVKRDNREIWKKLLEAKAKAYGVPITKENVDFLLQEVFEDLGKEKK